MSSDIGARVRMRGVTIDGRYYPAMSMTKHGVCDECVRPLPMGCITYITTDGRRRVCVPCGNRLDSSAQADAQAGGDV